MVLIIHLCLPVGKSLGGAVGVDFAPDKSLLRLVHQPPLLGRLYHRPGVQG